MEFYLSFAFASLSAASVSIPNGMEFYLNYTIDEELEERFNSQRDGILLRAQRAAYRYVRFQFPTGWNST